MFHFLDTTPQYPSNVPSWFADNILYYFFIIITSFKPYLNERAAWALDISLETVAV
jgi:hypothetical protein